MRNIVVFIWLFYFLSGYSQIGIGTTMVDSSAILEIKSSSLGVLLPHLTTNQMNSIDNPKEGLLIYNEDEGAFMYYKNNWVLINDRNTIEDTDTLIYKSSRLSAYRTYYSNFTYHDTQVLDSFYNNGDIRFIEYIIKSKTVNAGGGQTFEQKICIQNNNKFKKFTWFSIDNALYSRDTIKIISNPTTFKLRFFPKNIGWFKLLSLGKLVTTNQTNGILIHSDGHIYRFTKYK